MTTSKHPHIHIRRIEDSKSVHSFEFGVAGSDTADSIERRVERVMLGALTNLDRDRYYVDDSEVDKIIVQLREQKK